MFGRPRKDEEAKPRDHDDDCGCRDCVREEKIVADEITRGLDVECSGGTGFVVLIGYLAESPGAEAQWRLYLTLGFGDYVLLRDEDICKQQQVGDRSRIWVRAKSIVRYVRATTAEDLWAWFLQGPIGVRRGEGRPTGAGTATGSGDQDPPYLETTGTGYWECPQSATYTRCKHTC